MNIILDNNDDNNELLENKNLIKNSETITLNPREYTHYDTWGKKGDILFYSFSTSPQKKIEVWMMNQEEYNKLNHNHILSGILLTASGKSEGNFTFQYEDYWHLVFVNVLYSGSTSLTYEAQMSPYIVITHPSSSTRTFTESSLTITWESNIKNELVTINIYKGEELKATIKEDIDIKTVNWVVPEEFKTGDYKIKILSVSNEVDFSESFTIQKREFGILQPYEDRTLIPHTIQLIQWISYGLSSKVRIDLCLNFTPILEISSNTNNYVGSFNWTVWQGNDYSNTTHSNYQIRIQDYNTPKYFGFSPSFTITNEKALKISSPILNSSYKSGNKMSIKWETNYNHTKVRIELRKENQTIQNITTTSSNTGSFTWEIPYSIKTGDTYRIFIITSDNSTWTYSDTFTLKRINRPIPNFPYSLYLIIISIVFSIGCIVLIKKRKIIPYMKEVYKPKKTVHKNVKSDFIKNRIEQNKSIFKLLDLFIIFFGIGISIFLVYLLTPLYFLIIPILTIISLIIALLIIDLVQIHKYPAKIPQLKEKKPFRKKKRRKYEVEVLVNDGMILLKNDETWLALQSFEKTLHLAEEWDDIQNMKLLIQEQIDIINNSPDNIFVKEQLEKAEGSKHQEKTLESFKQYENALKTTDQKNIMSDQGIMSLKKIYLEQQEKTLKALSDFENSYRKAVEKNWIAKESIETIKNKIDEICIFVIKNKESEVNIFKINSKYKECINILEGAQKICFRIQDKNKSDEIKSSLENKSDDINILIIEDIITEGDRLKEENESKESIKKYKSCFGIIKMLYDTTIKSKIKKRVTDSIRLVNIRDRIIEGDRLREERIFIQAIQTYKACLSIAERLNDENIRNEIMIRINNKIINCNVESSLHN